MELIVTTRENEVKPKLKAYSAEDVTGKLCDRLLKCIKTIVFHQWVEF